MTGFKRVSVLALALLMVVTSVFAQGTKEDAAAGKQIELTVLNYIDMSEPNSANDITMVWDKFEAENPDIKIVREDLFNEPFHQKTEAYVASGQVPDVLYMWPSGRSTSLHTTRSVKDLKPFLEKDGLFDQYNPATVAPQFAGYLAMLPNGVTTTHMLYVNTKVLRDNGLAMPKSYADMKAMVAPLKAKGIDLIAMDNMDAWVMQSCLFSMVVGRFGGVDWYDRLAAGKISFTDEWFVKSLALIEDMYKSGMINRNSLTSPYGSSRGSFATGKAAVYIDGDWSTGAFQTDITTGKAMISPALQQSDFELMVIPNLPGEVIHNSNSGVMGTGWGMSANIPAGSAKEEAAWRLIKYLQGEYVQTYRLSTGASFPSNLNVDVEKVVKEKNLEPFIAKRAAYYAAHTPITPVVDGVLHSDVYNVINVGLQEIGLGSKTPMQVAAEVQKAWDTWKKNQ
ncbi:MAG: carbohydrate ABC transporter substrate-binding protein [Spirochaetales bacterium]|nr:carbohydrate ABC transporter substrate-binding protein [Spirochaetales bacterium]